MKILITGITGFVGSHMAEYYLNKGVEIYGTYRWRSKTNNIDHIKDKIHLLYADMNDAHSLEKVIKEVKPDRIHHLAAQSFVPMSWKAPTDTFNTNAIGTIHLFEAIKNIQNLCDPLIHVAGSSEEYGMIYEDELPIKETNPLRPLSPYGVSKIAQDMLCYQYNKSCGLKTILTRAFNHTGPRRGDVFVTSNFARQIVEIEKGKKEPIMYVGNLEAKRDFTDVRDIVRAYDLALEKGKIGERYNICSGKSITIKEMLDILLSFSDKKIKIEQDSKRMRPSDVLILEGDCSKFTKETGWKPEIPFEKTMKDLLNWWRNEL